MNNIVGVAKNTQNLVLVSFRRLCFSFSIIAVSLMTGCSLTASLQDSAREAADQTEAAMRETRENYHDRFDRISIQWMCTGMSYEDLVASLGGATEAAEFYNRVCVNNSIIPPEK